uniref:Retrotransposon protein, putative, unclassified n=1 Tax=Oryza sativa subsp. japonica TaxID=39947 RepID=Q2QS79_ORYSJ|nr:retrotransposon protein, putative, unclassified [Oryza sativa Japonica Group]
MTKPPSSKVEVEPAYVIPITLDDFEGEDRKSMEEYIKELTQEALMRASTRTRQGVIIKPRPRPRLAPNLVSNEEVTQSIQHQVASTIDSSMTIFKDRLDATFEDKFDEFLRFKVGPLLADFVGKNKASSTASQAPIDQTNSRTDGVAHTAGLTGPDGRSDRDFTVGLTGQMAGPTRYYPGGQTGTQAGLTAPLDIEFPNLPSLVVKIVEPHVSIERLDGQQFLDVSQLLQRALAQESWVKDNKKIVRPYEKRPNVNMIDYLEASDSEDKGDHDMYVAEWSWTNKNKPFVCSNLMPTPRKDRQSEVQSAIDEGRLKFTDGSKMKLDHDPFPVNIINFNDKKVLIRPEQAESTKEKGIIIGESRPKMIVPKKPEVGVLKENKSEASTSKAPRKTKVTLDMLLEKYEKQGGERACNNGKRPRSPPRERFGHSPRWLHSPPYHHSQDIPWGPYPMPPLGYPYPYYMPWGATPPMFNHMPPIQFNQRWGGPRRPIHEHLSSPNNGWFYGKSRASEERREGKRIKVEARTSELRSTTLLKRGNKSKTEYNHRTQQATPTIQMCKGIQGWFVAICIKAVVKHFIEQNSKTVE